MTTNLLHPLLHRLARCRTATDISGVAMDAMKTPFASHLGAANFFNQSLETTERAFFGVRQADVDEYEEHWRPWDRVFPAVIARAVPVHNWQVYREDEWLKDAVWTGYCRRLRIHHYMSVPIFGAHGRLAGVLNLCRRPQDRAFDATTLQMASAFSGFFSATLSRVAGGTDLQEERVREGLAPRELQVAQLAASGRNNVEIALELGIARDTVKRALGRVYRKLDVRGRAQMAARLSARGLLRAP